MAKIRGERSEEISPGAFAVTYDFPARLAALTDTPKRQWKEVNGPDSGCGLDYWYANKKAGLEAYINLDQGELLISVTDADGIEVARCGD